ncbi:RYamide receptor-like isoform X2 [Bradysia coprophila]|uniref:RYamide receptor-like isoform X2 n=1 Tax=Bradysia coprophila TaxID=38358 RepID=UPI00187D9B36|nr:RYamide receptor-like isoform X2 [Bradysia coprophila]
MSSLSLQDILLTNNSTWSYLVDISNGSINGQYAPAYPHGGEVIEPFPYYNHSLCDKGYLSERDGLSSTYFQTTVYIMYISIFLVALFGNGIVCYIVQSSPRLHTVTNFFIFNLAVGDILMSLFCVPFSFVSILLLHYWPFGSVMCHLVNYSQAVSVLVSAYTLVAISVDRYIAIMWPLRPRITKRYAKCIIFVVWTIALLTAIPIPVVSKLEQPDGWHRQCGKHICQENWTSAMSNYYYTLALLTLQFVIPLAVLIFTYTRIAIAVWGKRPPGEAENSRDQRMARSKRKMIKMMVTVVIVFIICWLPFNVLVLLLNDSAFVTWEPIPYFWFAFHWLAMSHSCYNPVIYCYMNARFRGGFVQILHCIPGVRRCFCVRQCARGRSGSIGTGFQLTGIDETSQLQRVNTSTTFISTRRKTNHALMQIPYTSAEQSLLQ